MEMMRNLPISTKPFADIEAAAPAIPASWVESLFSRMNAMYGNKFLDMWGHADLALVKKMWAEEMVVLTADEMRRGYAGLMKRDWPPTLPEFIRMCRPSIDPANAYSEAVEGSVARERGEVGVWSHPAVYWASVAVGAFDLKNLSYPIIRARWERAYEREMAKGQWPAVPKPHLALAAPGKATMSRENAAAMLREIGASGVLKRASNHIDTEWADKILAEEKKGNSTLSALQIRFAKIAKGTAP